MVGTTTAFLDRLMLTVLPEQPASFRLGEGPIDRAEARIGFPVPQAIRQFYSKYGDCRSFLGVQDLLLDIEDIYTEDGHLVLCHDNQMSFIWGVDLHNVSEVNPGVDVRAAGEVDWTPHYDTCTQFLVSFVLWQAVNGGMAFNRFAVLGADEYARVRDILNATMEFCTGYTAGVEFFIGNDAVIGISPEGSMYDFHVGYNLPSTFNRLNVAIGELKYLRY